MALITHELTRLGELADHAATEWAAACAAAAWRRILLQALDEGDGALAAIAAREWIHFNRILRGVPM